MTTSSLQAKVTRVVPIGDTVACKISELYIVINNLVLAKHYAFADKIELQYAYFKTIRRNN